MIRWLRELLFPPTAPKPDASAESQTPPKPPPGPPPPAHPTQPPVPPAKATPEKQSAPLSAFSRLIPPVVKKLVEPSPRRYHLGLDWGTSSFKMVLRDYGSVGRNVAMVLTPDGHSVRYPSTVVLEGGRLFFGWEAEARRARAQRVWDSLKARAAIRRGWGEPSGIDGVQLGHLVSLSLAHAIGVGLRFAREHASSVRGEARMGMTLGAPEPDLQVRSEAYLEALAPAYRLATQAGFDPQGQPVAACMSALMEVREPVLAKLDRSPDNRNRWLRPEVAAAMMWLFASPRVTEGPYTVVDIGAATTNASFFRIHPTQDHPGQAWRAKAGMAFLGAATKPPGMDELDAAIVAARGRGEDAVSVRGQEPGLLLHKLERNARVVEVINKFVETWAIARQNAWPKAPELRHWERMRYLVVGGGSMVPCITERFAEPPGYLKGKLDDYGRLADPGRPADLHRFGRGTHLAPYDSTYIFLLVAYGLSFHTGDMPDIALPNEVSPFRRVEFRRAFVSSEELGYEEK